MPIWPFKRRRRSVNKDESSQPLTEKEVHPARAATYPPPTSTPPLPIPRKSSKRGTLRKRRPSQDDEAADARWANSEKPPNSSDKENVPPTRARTGSREDITALPMSRRLESSPHLRPVDFEKPPIPYNFRTYSGSQTSLQRDTPVSSPPRPGTLRSRRSGYDSVPSRVQSAKRKKDDQLREEEIRAMSAHMPIPKRPGEGPLRRDSKKLRSLGSKDSSVSLPPAEEPIMSMSAILEQRGWEIGSIDVFNPRPAVRLSGAPQYVTPGSRPSLSPPSSPKSVKKEKEKMPVSRGSAKKRETIGNRADDLDASDIRLLLERDAKRRERRKKDHQEKLDKKLRSRGGRNRGDSDRKRREAEEVRRAEEAKQRAEDENRARELATPPAAIHPALRDTPETQQRDLVGLGIGEAQAEPGAAESEDQPFQTPLETPTDRQVDPFADPVDDEDEETTPTLPQEEQASEPTPVSRDVQMEDTAIETAREVPMSPVSTPPLSPVQTARPSNSLSQVLGNRRVSDLTPPPRAIDQRRVSDPKPERRAGAWATFFRRGGTKLQRTDDGKPAESSFANTSRESMRNQPIPAHLVDTSVQQMRRKSGTPVRTQSKFREDLPELPISPPDSRLGSPDVTTAAAAAAAARRAARSSAQQQDVIMTEADAQLATRNDTPVTPSQHRIASMASIDSEGSWLASGSAKRQSTQSNLAQRRADWAGSYEELGGDRDAEYVNRPTSRKISTPALAGPDPAEESGEDEASGAQRESSDPMTVHESVRRQPTLVHRDPRVKSREGLLTEYSAGDADTPIPTSAGTGRGSMEFDSDEPEPELQRASSVGYGQSGKGHARTISAGSARIYDVPPRSPIAPTSHPEE